MNEKILKELKELNKKLTILLIIELGKSGLSSKEIAKILNIADSTVRATLPISKIKVGKNENKKEK
jgi:DNA-binding NarL/FixJ family response regulator